MTESTNNATQHHRSACTECQRRKQKCNREWPCNHCQKRKVADKCSFASGAAQPGPERGSIQPATRKRPFSHEPYPETATSSPWDDFGSDFESLGYTASHLFAGLSTNQTRKSKAVPKSYNQYYLDASSCPQLKRALQLLPPRPYTDSMVQNFLDNVNFHFYILYPSSFLDEYRTWWSLRSENRPLGLQWTCLLLMVCACSTQYTDVELERKLEMDLGSPTRKLSEQYHNAARELHSVIPVGNNHLLNVQALLHCSYWCQSQGQFVEGWHVLSAAIREAQELGIHQETVTGHMSEFDREMRRRIWCILDTWDWQLSALLSRPAIVDRTDCDVGLPVLTLEGYSPSPLLHMKLFSEAIRLVSKRFGTTKNIVQPADVQEYQRILETWMSTFPPPYRFHHFDESNDSSRPWIVLHRHCLRTMSLSMMLEPFRAYLTKPMSMQSRGEELMVRSDGIDYALMLMDALHRFFDHVFPRDAEFHFVLFCIFDTAAVLCAALMHDQDLSIPRRDDMIEAIDGAVAMLKRLNNVTRTARSSYQVLVKVAGRIARPTPASRRGSDFPRPGSKVKDLALTPPSMSKAELAVASDADPASADSHAHYTTPPNEPFMYQAPAPQSTSSSYYYNSSDGSALYAPPTTMAPMFDRSVLSQPQPFDGMPMTGYGVEYPAMYMEYPAMYMDMTTPCADDLYSAVNLGPISEGELGDLAALWNYESLNLGFINPG
ncbi:uncharacterized protein UV8b_05422 [Ustilaginoidea virens]|uniref:Zn(2)-C6 fungal-type domain-containing protein n=1 Tax=Ustilaginoidea virens TaxID=1159556 RepID=A0A8E5HTY8_USTVR|nr:uncharacterized protein UV8b_05422 [Ustilaginoidea virens]QUC21179.1 hypothetical protein UV8b_05422 [Ustilaginoidea virens]